MQPIIGIAYGDAKGEIDRFGLGVVEVSRIRRDGGALNQYARSGLRTDTVLIDLIEVAEFEGRKDERPRQVHRLYLWDVL